MQSRHYLYIDFETPVSADVTLKKMTLRRYLGTVKRITGLAWAVDGGAADYIEGMPDQALLADLRAVALDPQWVVVAHNAAFDIRVWRLILGLPQPQAVHCTLELACAAFPNQPGGYRLEALAETLALGQKKLKVDLRTAHGQELRDYCVRDVELCRGIHQRCLPRIHLDELRIAELCNVARELHFDVQPGAIDAAIAAFASAANESAAVALDQLGADGENAFGWDGDDVRSVKPETLKDMLRDTLAFDTQSISFKKINPEKLRANEAASATLKAVERANKALSHKRRVKVFTSSEQVDCELGYFRAHTGRFSSPSCGKGLNLHNLSKRDKQIAKAIRTIFRLPEGLVAVRGDLANVEYRVQGLLTGAHHPTQLFKADVFSDPYLGFGNVATGKVWTKADAIRQLFKMAVLGLGYGMSLHRFIEELLRALADPTFGVTLADLEAVCAAQGWKPPKDRFFKAAVTKTRAPLAVATVGYYMRTMFHTIHPEYLGTARWLENTVAKAYSALDGARAIDAAYMMNGAPDRNLIDLHWCPDAFGPNTKNIRVRCGRWVADTVTWRDMRMIDTDRGVCLGAVQAGNKGYRPLSMTVLIENIVQSAARNAMCQAQLELERRGYPYQLTVHDELMLIVPQTVAAVTKSRQDMLDVLGPNKLVGWDWSVMVNPDEINVSKTLYEVDMNKIEKGWWSKLPDRPELLENLP